MIRVENLCRRYGDLTAVDRLSFTVNQGEVLGLVGPNGAGKTTTLRMLAGIVQPSSGSITIGGHDMAKQPIAAKQVTSYVPDDPRLFDALTVNEHLEITASLYGVKNYHDQIQELLKLFDLDGKRDSSADSLSLGMRQKLSICCAYLSNPAALIFDEPLTGLDPRGMRSIQQSIAARAEEGAAIIISSHILSLVEKLCSHILIIDEGQSLLYGSFEDILKTVDGANSEASLESVFLEITRDSQPN